MYRRDRLSWLKHLDFIILDVICLQVAYVLAYRMCGVGVNPYRFVLYRSVAVFLALADLVIIFSCGTMDNVRKRGHYRNFLLTLGHALIIGGLTLLFLFMIQQGQLFSRATLIMTIALYVLLAYLVRELWRLLLKVYRKDNDKAARLLLITSREVAEQTLASLKQNNQDQYAVAGIALLNEDQPIGLIQGVPVVANGETAPQYVCQAWIDEVLVVLGDNDLYPGELMNKLSETGVTVHLNLAKITSIPGKQQFVQKLGEYTVLTTSMKFASSFQLMLKRLMDIAGGMVGCLLTGIIFIFVAPIIYKASPGPIFFTQERVGRNGKTFKMYKFRSMYMDAEARKAGLMKDNKLGDGKMFKLDFDPRVIGNKILPDGTRKTGIGDFIRRTSLDEFPQFYNVLKGDMSIVGTRPPLPSETQLYDLHHRARLAIKPGITGMWQVSGRSTITDFEEVVRLDREYINRWDIGLDIKILLKTVLAVLRRDGAR